MSINPILTNLIILSVGIFIAGMALYTLIKNDLKRYMDLKALALHKETRATLLPLRLQAHERLIIFIDRINPGNLLIRLHQPGIAIKALQNQIVDEIKSEFQHNITQQLYIDIDRWKAVRKLKEDTIAMINNAVQGLPESAAGIDLSRKILQHMSAIEENPYDLTVDYLKKDIQQLF